MRITYFNYEWDLQASTGAATQIAQTIAGLERLGHEVLPVNRHRKPPGRNNGSGSRLHPWLWEAANYWRSLEGARSESRILREQRPDVVLTLHALRFSSLVAARRLGLPVVLQVNAPVPYEIGRYHPELRLLPALSQCIEHRLLRAAAGAFVVSAALRDYFTGHGVPPDHLAVIPNGADPNRFRPQAADLGLRARFPGKTLIGFAGSFARFHGLDLLEAAINHVAAQNPDAHFVLAGPCSDDLGRRLRGPATLLGHVPHQQMPGILAAMDVLVAPYAPQDFFYFSPIKLFEYMACGRAVLAPPLGQIAEVVRHDWNGVLYNPADPADFTRQLLALLGDPARRARLGACARQTILENYTWDHNARCVEQVLLAAIERAAPNRLSRPLDSRAAAV